MDPKTEILTEIKALSFHYPRRQLGQQDHLRWLDDYANDLAGIPAPDVRLACAQWRQSDARRMATPGELRAKCSVMGKGAKPILSLPPKPRRSEAEMAQVRRAIAGLLAELRPRDYRRLPGETETDYAERLWPGRRIDRVREARGVMAWKVPYALPADL